MDSNTYCVIMAGGTGSRFWPLSKISHPKQFVDILGSGKTLLQQTFARFENICPKENIFIVTNAQHKEIVFEQVPELNKSRILFEPSSRGTAPCIAYACRIIQKINPEANLIVTPSDHYICNETNFRSTIQKALLESEKEDKLITLGIRPSRPNTEYGYIQYDEDFFKKDNPQLKKVVTFTEKPEQEMALQFIESGDFLWNSGVFIWNLKTIESAFQKYLPDVYSLFMSIEDIDDADQIERVYAECRSVSIDYGIIEYAENNYVMISDFGWSDISTWATLHDIQKKDKSQNAIIGRNVIAYDTRNCVVNMPKNKLVVLQGLDNYIVVENDNILMVCKKSEEHLIKKFVSDVEIEKGDHYI